MNHRYAKNSDWVLRLDLRGEGESEPHWVPALTGFQTLGESRGDTTSEYHYLGGFGAPEQSVDGTSRQFAITGHRVYGDVLQDWLFSHERQWDTGGRVARAQYFNTVTGEGEQGEVSISFYSTQTGAPQERAAFGVRLAFQGTPAVYRHDLGPYAIRYDGNGGLGEVVDTREYGIGESVIVRLAQGIEAPDGKAFACWCTRADGAGTRYMPGDVFVALDPVTLYAIWQDADS